MTRVGVVRTWWGMVWHMYAVVVMLLPQQRTPWQGVGGVFLHRPSPTRVYSQARGVHDEYVFVCTITHMGVL